MVLSLAITYNYWRYLFFGLLPPTNNGLNSGGTTTKVFQKTVRTPKKIMITDDENCRFLIN